MAKSVKAMRDAMRNEIVEKFAQFAMESEDVGMIKSNAFNFPCVDAEGNEYFAVVTISIPTGGRDEEYDGYGERQSYEMKCEEKARKAAEAQAKKEAKIARDAARRAKAE